MATQQILQSLRSRLAKLMSGKPSLNSINKFSVHHYRSENSSELKSAQQQLQQQQERLAEEQQHTEQSTHAATQPEQAEQTKKQSDEIDSLTKELQNMKTKNDDLLDKYRRSLADSENLRTRLNKQISEAKIYGIQNFCKDLLEVADTLNHATQSVPIEAVTDDNPHLKQLYEGLRVTRASMMQVFKRHGLEAIDPLNSVFDPNLHEALYQKEDPSVEPNTVIEVTKLGYKLHSRVIRPALVGVSKP